MALLDEPLGRIGAWFWINIRIKNTCKICASGRRVVAVKRRVATKFYHPVDGKKIRCRAPWQWRLRVASGKMKVDEE